MSSQESLRDFIPPAGLCVPDEQSDASNYEPFLALDRGDTSTRLLTAAQHICSECPLVASCIENSSDIGDAMWLEGADNTVIGGMRITTAAGPKNGLDRATVAIPFDMSILPTDGPGRLRFLRQGVRAELFRLESRPPDNAKIIGQKYREMLEERDHEKLEDFDETLTGDEQEKALKYLILTLCQQADYPAFSRKVRSTTRGKDNQRYNPDTHDYEINYPTAALFVTETTALKQLGFKNPGRMAIYHSAEYGRLLIERFGGITSRATVHAVIRDSIARPHTALEAFSAKLQSQRGIEVPDYVAQRRALTNRKSASSPDESRKRAALRTAHSGLSASTVEKAMSYTTDPDQTLREIEDRIDEATRLYAPISHIVTPELIARLAKSPSYKTELRLFVNRYGDIQTAHPGNPDFTPGILAKLAILPSGLAAADNFVKRLKRWRGWAAGEEAAGYFVPDSFLVEHAVQTDESSYTDIVRAHELKLMQLRLRAKDGRRPAEKKAKVQTWMMHRILALYPIDQVVEVSDNLFDLLSNKVLTSSIAEIDDLQDPIVQLNLDDISDQRKRRYTTFSSSMHALSSTQRLMLAHHHNLTRLLYGTPIDGQDIANIEGKSKEDYDKEQLLELARSAVEQGANSQRPLSLTTIKEDVIDLMIANEFELGESDKVPIENIAAFIGGGIVELASSGEQIASLEDMIPDEYRGWFMHKFFSSYPPSEQEQGAIDIEIALRQGRLAIHQRPTVGYYPKLASFFYGPNIDDIDRAVAAQVMGVDRFLYGKAIGNILRYRLGEQGADLGAYLLHHAIPKLEPFVSPDESQVPLETIPESALWRVGERVVGIYRSYADANV